MKYIVFSDAQYYNNPSKSFITENGISSWLQYQLNITEEIFQTAIKEKVDFVLHNGDLFEEKSRINIQLYNRVWELYNKYSDKIKIILNTGNHDLYNVTGESSLKPFSEKIQVISEPTEIRKDMWVYPYGCRNFPKSNKDITLFIHDEVDAFCKFPVENSIKLKDLSSYDIVFCGHIHEPLDIGNAYSVGSIMINDFGEDRKFRRFLLVDNEVTYSIPINCPNFYDLGG